MADDLQAPADETTPTAEPADKPAKSAAKKAPAKKAPAKKAAAKKTAAEKAPAKKAPAKKAAKKAADVSLPGTDGDVEPAAPPVEAPVGDTAPGGAPAKKAAAKRTTAKKATTKKTSAKASAQSSATAKAADEAAEAPHGDALADSVLADSAPAVLFQAPTVTTTTRRRTRKTAETPAPELATDAGPAGETTGETTDEAATETSVDRPAKKTAKKTAKKSAAKKSTTKSAPPASEEPAEPADNEEQVVAGETSADTPTQTDGEPEADGGPESEGGSEAGTEGGGRRRRRRGGRRRRKSGDGGDAEARNGEAEESAGSEDRGGEESAEAGSADDGGADEGTGEGGTSRRRRRRRRSGEDGGETSDDPENTVTRVRSRRAAEAEITAVSGSTRLEAKKQRRREGREAGRRRAPIVSEAEFLARRESVDRVMVIRQREDLTQIGVLEDRVLVEHYVARESQTSIIGNVYLGRVQNVLPSMEAAFIDIGKGRNAVLYAGEVNWSALGHKEGSPRKIESVLSSGQTVLVQVTKDPIGHKGARLTSQISLAGRFLVYVPDGTTSGISRKLPDTERNRLKTLLKEIVPDTAGVIVRTAAEGASEDELTRDVERLKARWEDIEGKAKGSAPQLLYGEPDLTLKVVRDLFTEDFSQLVIQGDDAWDTVQGYVAHVAPDLESRLVRYDPGADGAGGKADVFAEYRIDEQIAKGLDRKVWLPSGGSLIIDRTEAMTVIDVNTGKFTGSGGNLEQTVTRNNLEAAEETVRQLRLRDIGGIVVIDFIDMVLESNRDLVLRRLTEALARDRTRHQVSEVTSLGLVQLTRKRLGTGLVEAFSTTCTHCAGRGIVLHVDPVDTAQAVARKAESAGAAAGAAGGGGGGGRRGKRGKKGAKTEPEEVQVAKVPAHAAGEHPMFKAMAAAGREEGDEDQTDESLEIDGTEQAEDQGPRGDGFDSGPVDEDLESTDSGDDDSDDTDDSDDDDSDDDDAVVGIDDDIDVLDDDDDDDDSDDDDSDDEFDDDEDDDDDSDEDDSDEDVEPVVVAPVRRPRRRAAARPAGPPVGED